MIFKIHYILLFSIFCLSCMEERDYFTTKEKKQLKDIMRGELEKNQEDSISEIDLRRNLQKHIEPLATSFNQFSSGLHLNCKCITTPLLEETIKEEGASLQQTPAEEATVVNLNPDEEATEEQQSGQEETPDAQEEVELEVSADEEEADTAAWVQGIGPNPELAIDDAVEKCSKMNPQWNDAACESVSL